MVRGDLSASDISCLLTQSCYLEVNNPVKFIFCCGIFVHQNLEALAVLHWWLQRISSNHYDVLVEPCVRGK